MKSAREDTSEESNASVSRSFNKCDKTSDTKHNDWKYNDGKDKRIKVNDNSSPQSTNHKTMNSVKCTFIATKQRSVELHLIVHNTKPPYQCTECDYKTSRTGNVNKHILAHNKDKPYNCQHCNSCFGNSSSLMQHLNNHHQFTF